MNAREKQMRFILMLPVAGTVYISMKYFLLDACAHNMASYNEVVTI